MPAKRKTATPQVAARKSAAPKTAAPKSAAPKNIDEYLAALGDEQRAALAKLRTTIQAAAPEAEEYISYGLCAFRADGLMLVGFGAAAKHCAFYLMSGTTVDDHQELLKKYDTSKGAIRFQPAKPLPAALVRKLVKIRLAENAARAKTGRKSAVAKKAENRV